MAGGAPGKSGKERRARGNTQVAQRDLGEEVAEVGGDGEIAPLEEPLAGEAATAAVVVVAVAVPLSATLTPAATAPLTVPEMM